MKKYLLLLALALGGLPAPTASAQTAHRGFTPGLMVGIARTRLLGNSNYSPVTHTAYQGGLTGDLWFSDQLSFHPELLYSWRAFDLTDANLSRDVSYLDVPLLARYHAGGLFFEAGPQLSVPLMVKNEAGASVRTEASPVTLDYVFGLGYQLPAGVSLGVRYDGGATRVFKNNADATAIGHANARTSTVLLIAGYSFGRR